MNLIHASGRFDRNIRLRRRVAGAQRKHTNLITRTEVTALTVKRGRWWGVLRKPGRAARGDCSIEHRRGVWKRDHGYVTRVSRSYRLGRRCWVLVGRYRRDNGHLVTVITAHLPATVETTLRRRVDNPAVRLDSQASAWLEAMAGIRKVIEAEHRERPHATIVVTADWNIDLRRAWARQLLQHELGNLVTLAEPDRDWDDMPGTHGRRVIDWAACSKPSVVKVLGRTDASDHQPIRVAW